MRNKIKNIKLIVSILCVLNLCSSKISFGQQNAQSISPVQPVSIEEMLRLLPLIVAPGSRPGTPGPRACGGAEQTPEQIYLPRTQFHLSPSACALTDRNAFFSQVCREVRNDCDRRFHDPNCWKADAARFTNPAVRQVVFRATYEILQRLTHDDQPRGMLTRCCATHPQRQDCEESFRRTGLSVLRGLRPEDRTLGYQPEIGGIVVSEGMLLGCRNVQCIESFLLHELGHRCSHLQYLSSDVSPESSTSRYFLNLDPRRACDQTSTAHLNFRRVIESQTLQCLGEQILSHNGACNDARFEELFASSVFSPQRNDPGHFPMLCGAAEDPIHFGQEIDLPCHLSMPDVRARLCPVGR